MPSQGSWLILSRSLLAWELECEPEGKRGNYDGCRQSGAHHISQDSVGFLVNFVNFLVGFFTWRSWRLPYLPAQNKTGELWTLRLPACRATCKASKLENTVTVGARSIMKQGNNFDMKLLKFGIDWHNRSHSNSLQSESCEPQRPGGFWPEFRRPKIWGRPEGTRRNSTTVVNFANINFSNFYRILIWNSTGFHLILGPWEFFKWHPLTKLWMLWMLSGLRFCCLAKGSAAADAVSVRKNSLLFSQQSYNSRVQWVKQSSSCSSHGIFRIRVTSLWEDRVDVFWEWKADWCRAYQDIPSIRLSKKECQMPSSL